MLQTDVLNEEICSELVVADDPQSEQPVLRSSNLSDIVRSLTEALFKLETMKEAEVDHLLKVHHDTFPEEGVDFYLLMELYEKSLIEHALRETHGNQTRAAKLLKIQLSTLNKKIKRHNIKI